MKSQLLVLFLLTALCAGCEGVYELDTLPNLGVDAGEARDINNHGDIVGFCKTPAGDTHAVLWKSDGSITDLGTLGGASSWASGINDDGVIVGYSEIAGGDKHAFMWRAGTMTDIHDASLPPVNQSSARAINTQGMIVGTMGVGGVLWTAPDEYVWVLDGSGLTGPTDALAINDANQVVGWHHDSDRAFLWQAGAMTLLPNLGVDRSRAFGINSSGQVVGLLVDPVSRQDRAARWDGLLVPTILGTLGGTSSQANAINDSGVIVGSATNSDTTLVPFYFNPSDGAMHELASERGGDAFAINSSGDIVGRVLDSAGGAKPAKWQWRKQ